MPTLMICSSNHRLQKILEHPVYPAHPVGQSGLTTLTERDANGNPTRITSPDGTVISATYDERGNLTSFSDNVRNGTRRLEYPDDFNRLTAITASRDNTTALTYEQHGNLTGLTSPLARS